MSKDRECLPAEMPDGASAVVLDSFCSGRVVRRLGDKIEFIDGRGGGGIYLK